MPMQSFLPMPGTDGRVQGEIQVYNNSTIALHINTSLADWQVAPDGKHVFLEAGTPELKAASCASWVSVVPAEFSIAPKTTVRVRYAVHPPQGELLEGERRAMIFFQSRPVPVPGAPKMALQVSMRIGHKLFVSAPGARVPLAKITDMNWQDAPRARLGVRVKNEGAATFRATGTLQVEDENGKVVSRGDLTPAQIFPGSERQMWFLPSTPLAPGKYKFKTLVNSGAKKLLGGEFSALIKTVAAPAPNAVVVSAPTESATTAPEDAAPVSNVATVVPASIPAVAP